MINMYLLRRVVTRGHAQFWNNTNTNTNTGELLPADMRSFGSALLGIIDNASLFVSVKLVPTITASFGGYI